MRSVCVTTGHSTAARVLISIWKKKTRNLTQQQQQSDTESERKTLTNEHLHYTGCLRYSFYLWRNYASTLIFLVRKSCSVSGDHPVMRSVSASLPSSSRSTICGYRADCLSLKERCSKYGSLLNVR